MIESGRSKREADSEVDLKEEEPWFSGCLESEGVFEIWVLNRIIVSNAIDFLV